MYFSKIFLESRFKRELEKGNLSKASIEKIKSDPAHSDPLAKKEYKKALRGKKSNKSVGELLQNAKSQKLIKSEKDWTKGVEKGTQNILKTHNALEAKHMPITQSELKSMKLDPHTDVPFTRKASNYGEKHKVYVPERIKSDIGEKEHAIIKRHESDEVRALNRVKSDSNIPKIVSNPSEKFKQYNVKSTKLGSHVSPEVLKQELKLRNTSKLYGGTPALDKMRRITGEDRLVKNMTKKDTRRIERLTKNNKPVTMVSKRTSPISQKQGAFINNFLSPKSKIADAKKKLLDVKPSLKTKLKDAWKRGIAKGKIGLKNSLEKGLKK
jgi:hypothetical protein